MADFLFRGSLEELDPEVHRLNQLEAERQYRRLILIPSESTAPLAVREALAGAFHNIYAEGYPPEETRWMREEDILDYDERLAEYRRYSDPRYYKGVEYADAVEALARRRCAETFAANGVSADDLYVNVQALSGGPANNAVYHALVAPGDTVLGMNLLHGGHLSHGSPVNRSGKYYNIVSYTVDPETERIDYETMAELAREHRPKMIIGGFSSYPWAADWEAMRAIADEAGAYLLADISHVGGLVAAKAYPSPVGHAHVITTTTHKTLCGPRGAVILTTEEELARKIDRAVFPGEQGGPHVNVFAALALAFKLAQTEEFAQLQEQIVKNCVALTSQLEKRGLRIPFGGTNTHLTNIDTKSITGPDGTPLSGDMAARILDLAGIVANRNTIPGDRSALNPSGVRMGTPWITQRGFTEKETVALADIIADVLFATTPYRMGSRTRLNQRAKVDFKALEEAKLRTRELALNAGIDFEPPAHNYPHFFYIDDKPEGKGRQAAFNITGERALHLLNVAAASDVEALKDGGSQPTRLHTPEGEIAGTLKRNSAQDYQLTVASEKAGLAGAWLRALSDGFMMLDGEIRRKAPGPVTIRGATAAEELAAKGKVESGGKPYYIGIIENGRGEALPEFVWEEKESEELKRTSLYETHQKLGAKMVPFAGWEMPVWYSSVSEEHRAVRETAGLFDVTHMGIYQVEGPEAAVLLDSVCANDIAGIDAGKAAYTHFLDPDANVIDDLYVYRWEEEKYLVVVNASNEDKDWAWLNAVLEGKVQVDRTRPWARAFGRNAMLKNLRAPQAGKTMRVDVALQGPASRDVLLALKGNDEAKKRIRKLKRNEVASVTLEAMNLIVAGTGYTGEKTAFEIFVHPEEAPKLWDALMKAGKPLGLKPCGLGARDSLRTEAGLPLCGNEMGGELNLGVAEAGFRTFVKTYKPWFIGREAFLEREENRNGELVRFRFGEKGTRMAHTGDPVVDRRGNVIGTVTSCAVDRFGTLTGQAFVDKKYAEKGAAVYIFQSAPDKAGKAPADLKQGDKITVPAEAQVLSRFPKL